MLTLTIHAHLPPYEHIYIYHFFMNIYKISPTYLENDKITTGFPISTGILFTTARIISYKYEYMCHKKINHVSWFHKKEKTS